MSSSSAQDAKLTSPKTIHDLEEAISALPPEDSKKRSVSGSKGKEKHGKEVFGLFRKCTKHCAPTIAKPFLTPRLQPVPTFRRRTTFQSLIPALTPDFTLL